MKKMVQTRQVIFILILSLMTLKVLYLPSLLARDIGRDLYIYIFMMMVFDFVILLVFLFIESRHPDLTFYEILQKEFGSVIAKIIMLLFFVFFLMKCWGAFQTNYSFLNENLYTTTLDWLNFGLPIIIVAFYVARFGVNTIARVIEISMPIIIMGLLVSLFVGFFRVDFSSLLPFLEKGFFQGVPKIINYDFWFGDYLIYIVFIGNSKKQEKDNFKISLWIFVAIIVLCLFVATFYAVYDYNTVCHSNAISDMLQILPSTSDLGNFDWILILVWDTALFLYFSLSVLGALYCLKQIFNTNKEGVLIVVILSVVLFASILINFDVFGAIKIAKEYLKYFCIGVQYVLPLLIFGFSFLIKRRRDDKAFAKK